MGSWSRRDSEFSRCSEQMEKASKCSRGFQTAGPDPSNELSDIYAAVADFAVVDPALRFLQSFAERSLGQTGFFPNCSKEARNFLIRRGVLRLGRHARR